MNETLKRCPFCGGDKVGLWYNRSKSPLIPGSCEVHCYDCHFGLEPKRTEAEAIEAWNRRAPLDHVIERLETNIDTAHEDRFMTYPRSSGRNFAYGVEIGLKKAVEIIKEEVG